MAAHSRSVVVISCTMGISAGTTLSSAPLCSTTAPFRWISDAGKMPRAALFLSEYPRYQPSDACRMCTVSPTSSGR